MLNSFVVVSVMMFAVLAQRFLMMTGSTVLER
jgi:hypothetical protein